jgi:acid phosphatase
MLVGDDLSDFLDVSGSSRTQRETLAAEYRGYWGNRWRMLPNPTYGSWERALYGFDYALDDEARTDRKRDNLNPET